MSTPETQWHKAGGGGEGGDREGMSGKIPHHLPLRWGDDDEI